MVCENCRGLFSGSVMETHPWKAFYKVPMEFLIVLDTEGIRSLSTRVKDPVPGPYSTTTSPGFMGTFSIIASPSWRELGQIDPMLPGRVTKRPRKCIASCSCSSGVV